MIPKERLDREGMMTYEFYKTIKAPPQKKPDFESDFFKKSARNRAEKILKSYLNKKEGEYSSGISDLIVQTRERYSQDFCDFLKPFFRRGDLETEDNPFVLQTLCFMKDSLFHEWENAAKYPQFSQSEVQ